MADYIYMINLLIYIVILAKNCNKIFSAMKS